MNDELFKMLFFGVYLVICIYVVFTLGSILIKECDGIKWKNIRFILVNRRATKLIDKWQKKDIYSNTGIRKQLKLPLDKNQRRMVRFHSRVAKIVERVWQEEYCVKSVECQPQ